MAAIRTLSQPSTSPTSQEAPDRIRLHISPLNPTILPSIIPPSILPAATDISFHSLQTFPERSYGFVELPAMDADKIKKKLHGSIVKGAKVSVEKARPKRQQPSEAADEDESVRGKDRRSKRRKHEEGVVPGVELPGGRQVQRGWAKPLSKGEKEKTKGKKRAVQASYSTKAECLFRTTLPPNAMSSATPPMLADTKTRVGERRVKDKAGRETVIHEFSSTTKYSSFLRGSGAVKGGKVVSEFVEGKGWVDEAGDVVEAVTKASKEAVGTGAATKPEDDSEEDVTDETSSSGASGSSEDAEDSDGSDESADPSGSDDQASETSSAARRKAKESLSITIPTITSTAADGSKPHPLEAIFKRPTRKNIASAGPRKSVEPDAAEASFTFFGPDEGADGVALTLPQTPFTQRDFHERGLRSAAPTPDTAAPGRKFLFGWRRGEDDRMDDEEAKPGEDEDDEFEEEGADSTTGTATEVNETKPPSTATSGPTPDGGSFEERFWARRGETNRAWKRRRRETGKEKRKRENKKLGSGARGA
ncbi:MAG: hypothetical protein M1832_002704 [Thelocarpon impressellum]|nr:MAG: hypothetical protein M1832_002704 [Thelocarpon impressellum]